MDHLRFVSAETKAALQREGKSELPRQHTSQLKSDAQSFSFFSWVPLPVFLGGLLDFPKPWWVATERVIFSERAEVARQVKHVIPALQDAKTSKTPLTPEHVLKLLEPEAFLTDDRANIILENYQLAGTAFYLASIVRKYQAHMSSSLTKKLFQC